MHHPAVHSQVLDFVNIKAVHVLIDDQGRGFHHSVPAHLGGLDPFKHEESRYICNSNGRSIGNLHVRMYVAETVWS